MSQDVMEQKDQRTTGEREPVREQPRAQQSPRKPERSSLFLVLVVVSLMTGARAESPRRGFEVVS